MKSLLRLLLLALLSLPMPFFSGIVIASPINYDEAIDGEITGFSEMLAGTGTSIAFGIGTNVINGEVTRGSSSSGSYDNDSFLFSVPSGSVLTNISIAGVWSGDSGNWAWAIRETPTGPNLFFDYVTDISPSKDPFLDSATPLMAGSYAFVLAGVGGSNHSLDYEYSFEVSAVPVPAAAWLFGTALIGMVGFSKRKARIAA